MGRKDRLIEELQGKIKELEVALELHKMLNLSSSIYTEPIKPMISQTCPDCNGTGRVTVFYPADNITGGRLETCLACYGAGVIRGWDALSQTELECAAG